LREPISFLFRAKDAKEGMKGAKVFVAKTLERSCEAAFSALRE
jgi:hypothetical protein